MARHLEIERGAELYRDLTGRHRAPDEVRRDLFRLSHALAEATREVLGEQARDTLCVIVLRGGLLLYPGFGHVFADADFCLLGMRRQDDNSVTCDYMTTPTHREYGSAVLIDCVAATGGTLLMARQMLAARRDIPVHVAAVVCSSRRATQRLVAEGIDVVGFGLQEGLDGDIVTPDLGEMDAGDLFAGLSVGSMTR